MLQPTLNFSLHKSTAPYMRYISYSKSIKSFLVGGTVRYMQWHSQIYGGGLFDYSVKPGPDFVEFKARFGHLVTRLARSRTRLFKARARSLTI